MSKSRMLLIATAFLLPWPAAAQTPVTFCDSTFPISNWSLSIFSNGTGPSGANPDNVTATNPATGGDTTPGTAPGCTGANASYRAVTDLTPAYVNGEGVVWGVHIYTPGIYSPGVSGAIAAVQISLAYECENAPSATCTGNGQGFGPALEQGGKYFLALPASSTGAPAGWKPALTSAQLTSADFCMVSTTGTTTPCTAPDFSTAGAKIKCGFYTGNGSKGNTYKIAAGYDNWSCTITPEPAGTLKICKVAGPGVIVGTPVVFAYSSTAGSGSLTVPAGAAPGGYCALAPALLLGTNVTVKETIPAASAVTAIDVAPVIQLLGSPNLGTGIVKIKIGAGVTEVTYTDETKPDYETGYLEICKKYSNVDGVAVAGNFEFTASPGVPVPIIVPAGACSSPIQVKAGPVIVKEVPSATSTMVACSTIPSSLELSCSPSAGTSTVNVLPSSSVSTQTIAIVTNVEKSSCTNCNIDADPESPNQ